MRTRHLVTSVDGMVAQLVNLISKGYRYYFVGKAADIANRAARDQRMLDYYDAGLPKWTRERRRRRGHANFRYLRYEGWFIVLATEGDAPRFWTEDALRIRDVRDSPIPFKGYSIGYVQGGYQSILAHEKTRRNAMWAEYRASRDRGEKGVKPPRPPRDMKWHVRVELDDETFEGLKAYFLNIATHRAADFIAREFIHLTFQPYRPVREQLRTILRAVNKARREAGFQMIPFSVIPFRRRLVKPFQTAGWVAAAETMASSSEPLPQIEAA
ncbi:MAG: hypothetical protein L0228_20085 [Planctomycetes bacterium]|nr:hypothetical protein [Planctomycetota bacterium]